MIECLSTVPLSEIILGILVLGGAITVTIIAWLQSVRSRDILPKGFKQKSKLLEIFR